MKRELEEITNEQDRLKYFENLVKEFDKEDYNNERKHIRSERKDHFNITTMDSAFDPDNMGSYVPPKLLNLCKPKDWDDIIFSENAEDLPELVEDRMLRYILKKLPQAQKEVFYYRVIKGYTAEEIAELRGTSDRNIRKLYEKALQHIREKYLPVIELKRKFETDDKYREIVQEQDIYTTIAERKYLDLLEEEEKTA